jgi:glycosyltransferase involved in cell wall biosynthesis
MTGKTSPFRVLHLRASNFVGGPERQILRYARQEKNGEFDVVLGIFCGTTEGLKFAQEAEAGGITVFRLPAGTIGDLRTISALRRLLAEQRIDLVCTHGYKADLLGVVAGRLSGIPVASFLRGWTGENWKVRAYEALDRFSLRFCTRIVCLSGLHAEELAQKKALRDRIRVVSNAVDVPEGSPDQRQAARQQLEKLFSLPSGTSVIACAGRLSPEKGTTFFIEAAREVHREMPGAAFIVFGDGPLLTKLKDLAKRWGLNQVVHFAGFCRDFDQLLPGIDVIVNPSLAEQMPNVVMESMAAGIPVIATEVGAVSEIKGKQEGLLLVPAGDAHTICVAVLRLLKNKDFAETLGRTGRERIANAFSSQRQRDQLRDLYRELVLPGSRAEAVLPSPANHELPSQVAVIPPLPFISVVIPVRNEEKHIATVLDELIDQDYPPDRFEIIVTDGNSTDRTVSTVNKIARSTGVRIVCLPNPAQLSSAGRNVGVVNSSGEYVLFVDGHCRIMSRSLLRDLATIFEESRADCLCRSQPLDAPDLTPMQKIIADVRGTALGHGLDSTIYSQNLHGFIDPTSSGAAYRRDVFDSIGLYNENFDACEDVEFNYRVKKQGFSSYIDPRLKVHYYPRASLSGLWKQMARYGRGRFRFVREHPDALSVGQLLPPAMLGWFIAAGIVSVFSSLVAKVLLTSLMLYAGMVLAFSISLGVRNGWRHFVIAPAVYPTIHFALGYSFCVEAIITARLSTGSNLVYVDSPGHSVAPRQHVRKPCASVTEDKVER